MTQHGCNHPTPAMHPWRPEIIDCACGYDDRLVDPNCAGCHRARAESPLDQLQALDEPHNKDGIKQ